MEIHFEKAKYFNFLLQIMKRKKMNARATRQPKKKKRKTDYKPFENAN